MFALCKNRSTNVASANLIYCGEQHFVVELDQRRDGGSTVVVCSPAGGGVASMQVVGAVH